MDDIVELHGKRYHNSHSRTLDFKRISRPYFSTKGDLTSGRSPQMLPRYSQFTLPTGEKLSGINMGAFLVCVLLMK